MCDNIPRNVRLYSPECLATFAGMLGYIPRNVWRYSPECLVTFPGMFDNIPGMFGYVPRNVWRYSPEFLSKFPGMFSNIPWIFWRHSSECLSTFPGMFGDIPWNVWQHFPECLTTLPGIKHSPHSPRSIPRSCIPGFIHSLKWLAKLIMNLNTNSLFTYFIWWVVQGWRIRVSTFLPLNLLLTDKPSNKMALLCKSK